MTRRHLLVGAEGPRLAQERVDQRPSAVVDVRPMHVPDVIAGPMGVPTIDDLGQLHSARFSGLIAALPRPAQAQLDVRRPGRGSPARAPPDQDDPSRATTHDASWLPSPRRRGLDKVTRASSARTEPRRGPTARQGGRVRAHVGPPRRSQEGEWGCPTSGRGRSRVARRTRQSSAHHRAGAQVTASARRRGPPRPPRARRPSGRVRRRGAPLAHPREDSSSATAPPGAGSGRPCGQEAHRAHPMERRAVRAVQRRLPVAGPAALGAEGRAHLVVGHAEPFVPARRTASPASLAFAPSRRSARPPRRPHRPAPPARP